MRSLSFIPLFVCGVAGQKLPLRFFKSASPSYFEIDLDISASKIADNIVGMCRYISHDI